MKQHLLLLLSANHLHAQYMDGGKLLAQHDFPDTPEGRESFTAMLQTMRCPAYLLTDLIEEDFRQETVLHLRGGGRTALLQRKFDQYYRSTPFREATLLQRQKTGRRDDDMLFSALTNPALILPWLDIILAQQIPLAGIYSIPQISAPLIKDHASNHLLLISWRKLAGLRQTYFNSHRLQISRLTPVYAELSFRDAVIKELARTYQYLKSLSLLPTGQILDVRIMCHADDRDQLRQQLSNSADMHYDFVDINELARSLNIESQLTDSDASQVFLYELARRPPKVHYANAEHTRYFTLWHLRRAFYWTSTAVFIASLLWSATYLWQGKSANGTAASLNTQAQHILAESQQITQAFPNAQASATDMKTGVSIMRKLEQYESMPDTVMQPISAALTRFPQINLLDLSWQTDAAEPVTANTLGDVPAQVIKLKANLQGFKSDYRAALKYLDDFQHVLNAHGYQVITLSKPLDISPGGRLTDPQEAHESSLDFSLKLVWRPAT